MHTRPFKNCMTCAESRICTHESNDVGKRVDFAHPVAAANTWRTQRSSGASGFRAEASQHSEEIRPKCYQGNLRCRARAGGQGKPIGPDRPLGKGVRGIKKERAERRGWDRVPMKKQDQGGKSSLGQPCFPIAAPLSRVEARPVSC